MGGKQRECFREGIRCAGRKKEAAVFSLICRVDQLFARHRCLGLSKTLSLLGVLVLLGLMIKKKKKQLW